MVTTANAAPVETTLVTPITDNAQRLLLRPNSRPLPSQRRNRKKVADAHARANVTLSPNVLFDTLRPSRRRTLQAKLSLRKIAALPAPANRVPNEGRLSWVLRH